MEKERFLGIRPISLIFGISILFGLYLTSLYSYLLFHSLAEIFSIVIACGIFMIAWNSRGFIHNNYLLFLGIAYLFVGGLDLIHTIAYKGMGVFPGYETNLATQLWLIARYTESLSLLLAPLFLKRILKVYHVFSAYVAVVFLLLISIFYWDIFPVCFIEGVGLTPFKKISEYIISLILLGSAVHLLKHQQEFDRMVLQWIFWSILLTIGSELAFTFYIHAYGFSNLIGHYFKIVSFYFIYKALIETGLTRPYDLLFKNLKQSEEVLEQSQSQMAAILRSISDGFFTLDNDLVVTYFNQAAEQLLGRKVKDILGRNIVEAFPEAKGSIFEEKYRQALKEKKAIAFETYFGIKPYENWYDVRVYPYEHGISVYFLVTTQKKRAEESIRKSKERFEILSETSNRLLTTDRPQEIMNELCRRVMTHLDCHAFFNYLVDEGKGRLHLNAYAGISEKAGKEMEWLDYGVAVCGCAARDACRIVAEDIPNTPDPRTDLVKSFGIKAYACHPLFSAGRIIGTLSFGTRSRTAFNEEELSLMKTVADQVAISMDRIGMIEALRQSRDELDARVRQRTAELAKANDLLERMFSGIDVLIAYMDKDFNFIRVNRAYANADQREPGFYVGKNHFTLFPNDENEQIFKKVVETGEPYSTYAKPFEYAEHPERGVTHWDWNLQPVKEPDGGVGGVVLSLVNVTDRIRAQEAVAAEHQRFNDVLEVLPAYVVLLTPDHHVPFANRFFRERFGESHGSRCFEYLFGRSEPCEICETYNVLKTEAPHQWEWTGPDGRIYEVFDFPFTDSDGSPLILEMGTDITERKEIEKRTNATNQLLMLFTHKTRRKEYLDALVHLIHDWSKCRCVGIRVRNGQGFIPYEAYIGFGEDFRKSEDWLSMDRDQCACIRVIQGKPDPQDASVMTPAGSFLCNHTLKFIEHLSEEEKARYRGVCVQTGFLSVAVIPLRYRDEIIGAIHLADERQEMVPMRTVDFIETMTPLIGEAIHRFNLESELHRNYDTQKAINSLLRLSLEDIPLEEFLEGTLDMLISNPWFSPQAMGSIFLVGDDPHILAMKAQYGLPDSIQKRCARVPLGVCLCGKIALTRKIQYTGYPSDGHDFTFEETTPHSHYHVPILYGERILGLIALYMNETDRPSREKEDLLTAVAHTLASIIVRKKWEEALQESETRLRLLSSQLLTAQEDERRQVARDLHDGIGQMLTALKFKIEDLLQRGDSKNAGANAESLESVIPIIRESIEEVRRIQMDLRPSTLDDLGIVATLRWFCREFEKIYSTFHIEKQMEVKEHDIPDHLKTVIYRIIQEAMNNIAKHSKANLICLSLEKREGRIELTVEDNGIGFDPEMARKGFGLGSMRERTEFSGGIFGIESAISTGTKIRASWTI